MSLQLWAEPNDAGYAAGDTMYQLDNPALPLWEIYLPAGKVKLAARIPATAAPTHPGEALSIADVVTLQALLPELPPPHDPLQNYSTPTVIFANGRSWINSSPVLAGPFNSVQWNDVSEEEDWFEYLLALGPVRSGFQMNPNAGTLGFTVGLGTVYVPDSATGKIDVFPLTPVAPATFDVLLMDGSTYALGQTVLPVTDVNTTGNTIDTRNGDDTSVMRVFLNPVSGLINVQMGQKWYTDINAAGSYASDLESLVTPANLAGWIQLGGITAQSDALDTASSRVKFHHTSRLGDPSVIQGLGGGPSGISAEAHDLLSELPDPATVIVGALATVVNDGASDGLYVAIGAAVGSPAVAWVR